MTRFPGLATSAYKEGPVVPPGRHPPQRESNVWPGLSQGDVAKEEKQATRQNRGSIHPSPFTLVSLPPPVGWVKPNNPSSGISRGANLEACPNLDKSPEQCPINLGKLWDSKNCDQSFRMTTWVICIGWIPELNYSISTHNGRNWPRDMALSSWSVQAIYNSVFYFSFFSVTS